VEDMMSHGIMHMVNVVHFPLLKEKLRTHILGAGTVLILGLQSKVLTLKSIKDQQMSFYNCNFIVLWSPTGQNIEVHLQIKVHLLVCNMFYASN
jgi:hypothetical protein